MLNENFGTFAPYTWFNTLVYGLVLSLAVFLLLWAFKRLKVNLNRDFFVAVTPWVVFGATARALVDANFYPVGWFFVAPGIYLLMFGLFVAAWWLSVIVSKLLNRMIKWQKLLFWVGFALLMYNIVAIATRLENFQAFLVFAVFAVVFAPFVLASRFKQFSHMFSQIFTKQNLAVVGAHLFDASATFVALTFFSYAEKHVLPTAVMGLFGPVAFFALKLLVIIPAIIVIDYFVEDKNTNNSLKFVLFVLGFAPGVRDLCRMIMMC